MKSKLEMFYFISPIWLQNFILSVYGSYLSRIQRGDKYRNYLDKIRPHLHFTKEEIKAYQLSKFKIILNTAVQNVPWYRKSFNSIPSIHKNFKTLKDLENIPLLEKISIRKYPKEFINLKYTNRGLSSISTTGTTGTPLKIYYNADVRQLNFAFFDRFLEQGGINFRGKIATFGGRIIVPPNQCEPPFWRKNYFQKNTYFSSYHLTSQNIDSYLKKIYRLRPEFIDTYPSTIYLLAEYMQDNGIAGKNFTNGITTSSETLQPYQRQVIESAFGLPVLDQYGSAEMCVSIGQCRLGRYHIHMDYGIVEFLREDGSNAYPGEEAEIVCTGLINPVMPLIRYKIGDRGILSDKTCDCGCQFQVVDRIIGRMDDIIVTPDGRKTSRFGSVVYNLPVVEVQYLQKQKEYLTIRVAPGKAYTDDTEAEIKNRLRKRLGNQIKFNFVYFDHIPRGRGAKLKTIVSEINTNAI